MAKVDWPWLGGQGALCWLYSFSLSSINPGDDECGPMLATAASLLADILLSTNMSRNRMRR